MAMSEDAHGIMDTDEIEALYQCRNELCNGIDPILVASQLLQRNRLSYSVYSTIIKMFEEGRDRTEMSEHLICNLPFCVNIPDLTQVLYGCEYIHLASKLFMAFLRVKGNRPSQVQKSRSGQTASVHAFFRQLKRMVHDAQLTDPRIFLNELANRYIYKMNREKDVRKQQLLADRCAAIIGAQIDAIAITFDSNLCSHSVFDQMKRVIPKTSNTLIFDVQYYGRLANANAIVRDFESGEDMLVAARSRAYMTGPCLELVNMLYIEVYVKLWQFEMYPTKATQDSLLMWGRIGLESLEEEEVDTRTLWRRMFILRMVFCLIGIGNRANIIPGCSITEANISEAEKLLAVIDRNWAGIETRRKMFYYVAKARICELKGNSESLLFITKAKALANEGHFAEIQFIEDYQKQLTGIGRHETIAVFRRLESPPMREVRDQSGNDEANNTYGQTRSTQASRNFVVRHSFLGESFGNCSVRRLDERANLTLTALGLRTEMSQTENKEYLQSPTTEVRIDDTCTQYHEILDCNTQIRRYEDLTQPSRNERSCLDHVEARQRVSSPDRHALNPVANEPEQPVPKQKTAGIMETFSAKNTINLEQTEGERISDSNDAEEIQTSSALNEWRQSCNFNSIVLFESRGEASGCSNDEHVLVKAASDSNKESDSANDHMPYPPLVTVTDICSEDQISIKSDDLFGD